MAKNAPQRARARRDWAIIVPGVFLATVVVTVLDRAALHAAHPSAGAVAAPAPGPGPASDPDDRRNVAIGDRSTVAPPDENVCGVNSLYMLLHAWGMPVTAADVKHATPRGSGGTSLRELRQAAGALGVATRIYRCKLEDLGVRCPLPAIAMLRPEGRPGMGTREYPGHFVLVHAVDPGSDGRVSWVDGTFGFRLRKRKPVFSELWTGYVLARPEPPRREEAGLVRLTLLHLGAWLAVGFWFVRRGEPRPHLRSGGLVAGSEPR